MGISAYFRSDTRLIPTPTPVPSGQWNLGRSVPLAAPEVLGRGTWGATYRETLCRYIRIPFHVPVEIPKRGNGPPK
jgi:hypothetical protein